MLSSGFEKGEKMKSFNLDDLGPKVGGGDGADKKLRIETARTP